MLIACFVFKVMYDGSTDVYSSLIFYLLMLKLFSVLKPLRENKQYWKKQKVLVTRHPSTH